MNNCGSAVNGTVSPTRAVGGQMSKKMPIANPVSLRAHNGEYKDRRGPGCGTTQRPSSTVYTLNGNPSSHQRCWSVDFSKRGTSPVITVRKNKKEPQPPQRGVSLLRSPTAPHSSLKRYSCPPIGILTSPDQSSSSSSSSTSSCSSPPPIQTSVITGHDPQGWKLRPKSTATTTQARANRLSLQIPLPAIPAPGTPNPEPSPKPKPAFRPKPSRRHHSDTSAFIRSLEAPLPAVTLEELCAVQLHPPALLDEPDDVFSDGAQEMEQAHAQSHKTPPLIPAKTAMARQMAQLIAYSRQSWRPVTAKSNEDKHIHTSVIKPQPKSHRTGQ